MNLENIQKNGTKMMMQFALPCVIAMVLTSAITLVDGYFIGNYVGKEGTAAVNLGLPLVYFYLGVGIMIGVGGIAQAGIAFGSGAIGKCNQIFRESIGLTALVTMGVTVVVALAFFPVSALLDIDGVTVKYFQQYYFIILFELPLMIINNNLGIFMRGEGKPQISMFISILSLILNSILDYLAVRVFDFGIAGIAASSLVSVMICLIISVLFFVKGAKIYHLGRFRFEKEDVKQILLNGSSELIGEMSMCITMGAYNAVVLKVSGVPGVAAFAVVGYVSYLMQMIMIGIGQGMTPLVSFVYGAKDIRTAKKLRRDASIVSTVVGTIAFIVMVLGRDVYSQLFIRNSQIQQMISVGILIFSGAFILAGFNTMASFYYTAIGHAKESAVISMARGLIILLIALFVLPKFLGMMGVWLVAPVTELITVVICLGYYARSKTSESQFYLDS